MSSQFGGRSDFGRSAFASGTMQRSNPIRAASRDAKSGLCDGAHFPAESHLAEDRRARPTARFLTLEATAATTPRSAAGSSIVHATRNIDVDVFAEQMQAGALLHDREQQRQALLIDAARHAAGVPEACCS